MAKKPTLNKVHSDYLADHAVDLDLARSLGIFSAAKPTDLPEKWRAGIGRHLPGIVLPWTSRDGREQVQLRPDEPQTDADGNPVKYVFQADVPPVLWQVRKPAGDDHRILVVEGSKQCLVAARHAPAEFAVYGVAGCWGWSYQGSPIPDLEVADGREVVVVFDADAATNYDVWTAGNRLAEALKAEGASSIRWVRLPAGQKAGLDDVLAGRKETRRGPYLARLIDGAKEKISDRKPDRKSKKRKPVDPDDSRPLVLVDEDRLTVITSITDNLIDKLDGTQVFNHGGVISQYAGGIMNPVDKGSYNNLLMSAVRPVTEGKYGMEHTWPDANTNAAVLAQADKFTPLDRITEAPFVRPDGTVCTEPGYDESTRTFLVLDPGLDGISVPESPTQAQIEKARDMILGEWFGDMPFAEDGSQANALALILTPIIRGLVPIVPLAVVDGLQMGVGKNLLADCLSIVMTGRAADPKPYTTNDEEHRKVMTAAFRAGGSLFVFDEAHTLEGANFARAITSSTYSDRILGVSTMAEFPNRVTWVSLGNQVKVKGDMSRRVYRIGIWPKYSNPQDRPSESFRHPDLRDWTRRNRSEILTACLTLVRAWFAAGQPPSSRGVSFGSFETWERISGGILGHAGVEGFLDNLSVWRSETDFVGKWWAAHLEWLHDTFGMGEFTSADVVTEALADLKDFEAPPGLDDPAEKGFVKKLGEAYSRIRSRRFGKFWIVKAGEGHRGVSKWIVGVEEDTAGTVVQEPQSPAPEPEEGQDGGPEPPDEGPGPEEEEEAVQLTRGEVVFDLETADANQLHSYGAGFVRLAGVGADSEVVITPNGNEVAAEIRAAEKVIGHNIMAFDLPALVRWHGLGMDEVHLMAAKERLADTILMARQIDPPMARAKGVDAERKYNLDRLGDRYGLGGKSGDLKALAKEFGGFDQIPVDDPRYVEYLRGDVELSTKLHGHLDGLLTEADRAYLAREHRIAAIAAQMSLNGFRVDLDLLARKVAEGNERKNEAMARISSICGIPLTNAKGVPYKSPLSTKAGKQAVHEMFTKLGATSIWTTEKEGTIQLTLDAMRHIASEYAHLPKVAKLAKLIARVVTTRTVYQTVSDNLVGDRVHPSISFAQATGRWSSTRPGMTVMGKRGGRFVERDVFLADPGHMVLAVDLSQVDMRAVAGLSGDRSYIEMLRTEDPHMEISRSLFGDEEHREESKAIGHGWNYGRSIKAISQGEEIEPKLVIQFDRQMQEQFPRLVQWRDEVREQAGAGELLDNGFGRKMRPDSTRAWTQGPALKGQGGARDIMMEGLLRLADRHPETLGMLRAQVHDEIILSVPADDIVEVGQAVVEALSFEWKGVPIVADGGATGQTWGDCYRKE